MKPSGPIFATIAITTQYRKSKRGNMTTTFDKYPVGKYTCQNGGHSQKTPTIDVLILSGEKICDTCEDPIVYSEDVGSFGGYRHVNSEEMNDHHVSVRSICRYCGTNDPQHLSHTQAAWSDDTECSRCGGQVCHGIGD